MKTSQSKKSNPKTKGSVLSASLVLKNFLKQKPNPPTQQISQKKKKETNREKTLCWKEEKGLEVDHVVKIDREIPFIEHIY
ncbi:hypothetical protein [Helicobacter pylori]|uniref:hypothetical protein n=1 Tax=Helicobacter pylori TaxID=210 RepID=UPI0035627497